MSMFGKKKKAAKKTGKKVKKY